MYNVHKRSILNYNSTIYVAKKLETIQDEDLNQIEQYAKPIKYRFNVQVANADSEIREFGELANSMKVILINNKDKYLDKFTEFDKVYIKTNPKGEVENGLNADYRIYSVREQNTCIRIYAIKLVK